jgi:hypothetical protein
MRVSTPHPRQPGRGGYRQDAFSDRPGDLLRDTFSLRDDEQLLVKFSYRFEL